MTCYDNSQVNIKDNLEGNEGAASIKYEPFVEIKEKPMPDLDMGEKEEKVDEKIIPEQDVITLDETSNKDSIGAVVVMHICTWQFTILKFHP